MGDRVEKRALCRVGKNDGSEGGTIESTIDADDGRAEFLGDAGEGWLSRFDDLPSQLVGVDMHGAEFG